MSLCLTNEQRNHFIDRVPWSPYWSDSFKSIVDPYLEICNNKSTLVICYGDSWTWGDSLGESVAAQGKDDRECRLKNLYGRKLADALNADFVNWAIPGIYNYWIHNKLKILLQEDLPRLQKQYQKIYIVVTLTEVGRDFEFPNYVDELKSAVDLRSNFSCDNLLRQAEWFDFKNLQRIEQNLPSNCQLIVGRNFTDTWAENKLLIKNLITDPWAKVLADNQSLSYTEFTPIMSFGIQNFNKFVCVEKLDSAAFKQDFINLSQNSSKRIEMLEQSVYNYKKASKHPTPQGHEIWANYLHKYILDNNL